jgi:hypothetical protein
MKLLVLSEDFNDVNKINNLKWKIHVTSYFHLIGTADIPIIKHQAKTYIIKDWLKFVMHFFKDGNDHLTPSDIIIKAAIKLKELINRSSLHTTVSENFFKDDKLELHDDDEFDDGHQYDPYAIYVTNTPSDKITVQDWRITHKASERGRKVDIQFSQNVVNHMSRVLEHNKSELISALDSWLKDKGVEL